MNFSARERRLLIGLVVVVALLGAWLLFLKPSSEPIVLTPDMFATPSVAASPSSPQTGSGGSDANGSDTFVVPVGARDPFKP